MSEQDQHEAPVKTPTRKFYVIAGIIFVVLLLFLFFRAHHRRNLTKKKADEASAPSRPVVNVVTSTKAPDTTVLLLPGQLQGIRETSLYARVSGYVKNWYVDIGDKVKEGQPLADLETPELDQQLDQAKAAMDLAKTSLDRVNSVTIEGAVSQQQKADRQGAYATAVAQYNQLVAQKSFKHVIAPFSGVITSRNIDIGTLINAGNSGTQQLFTLAQIQRLRTFVNVPQQFSTAISVGTKADVLVEEIGNLSVHGIVTRTAGALNQDTRTLLVQVEFNNADQVYLPGMYANIKFLVRRPLPVRVIPANTLIIRTGAPQVLTVQPDSTLLLKTITIERDNGSTLEIASGIEGNEKLVSNASLDLVDGMKVTIAPPKKKKGDAGEKGSEARQDSINRKVKK